jgi:hypothetical protein
MMHKPEGENKNKRQLAAFRKAARELEADESEALFNTVLRTVAKQKAPSFLKKTENPAKNTK